MRLQIGVTNLLCKQVVFSVFYELLVLCSSILLGSTTKTHENDTSDKFKGTTQNRFHSEVLKIPEFYFELYVETNSRFLKFRNTTS